MDDAKPTLHEIAAMPLPASIEAMRKHYNPKWGMPVADGGERPTFRVKVHYETRSEDYEIVDVEAFDEAEALDLAEEKVAETLGNDVEIIDSTIIKPKGAAQ
jgi:hypothetical protein